jgi:hypothetical protein
MTNGAVALLRRRWASLMAWVAAMDYSAADYTNDRWAGTRGGATEGRIKADPHVCRSRRRRLRTKCTAGERILAQYRLNQDVGVTQGQVYLQPSRKQRHGTRSSSLEIAFARRKTSV